MAKGEATKLRSAAPPRAAATPAEEEWAVGSPPTSPSLARLSKNVLREICYYLQSFLYPCISDNTLAMYDLTTGAVSTTSLSRSFKTGTVFCLYRLSSVLCVGAHPASGQVIDISLPSGTLTQLPDMSGFGPGLA